MKYFRIVLCGVALVLLLSRPGVAMDNVTGKVVETMNSGGYTYLKVEAPQGAVWAAIPQTNIAVGQQVTLLPGAVMEKFSSKTLNRTFDSIIFSSGLKEEGKTEAKAAAPGAQNVAATPADVSFSEAFQAEQGSGHGHTEGSGHGHGEASGQNPAALNSTGSAGAVVPSAEVQVTKAEGENGRTIAELYEQATALNNKTVMIRAKVMKVSKMIMGKNWLHLQDGTGDPLKNSHDLVVTTMAEPAKDAVVLVEGVLHANKDFGFGYHYQVIIEDAKIK